jgi:nicotinamidase-related amidase
MLTFQGREIPETLTEIVDPRHTVMIVHDMQKDNTGRGGVYDRAGRRIDVSDILPAILQLLSHARHFRVRVMYTQYTNLPNFGSYSDPRIRSEYHTITDPNKRWTLEALIENTSGWETIDELKPRSDEVIIRKYRVDAFIGTPLEYLLRINRIRTIIHTGIATEVGILPTAWHALNLGFFVVVPEDCVGPMERQYHHEAMSFLRRLALVVDSSDIIDAWKTSNKEAIA